MEFWKIFVCFQLIIVIQHISCQREAQQPEPLSREEAYRPPPPRILSHTQAQSHDGGFKFAYQAENGLTQSEVIAPDGTRNGGYSYVDSLGKKITVRYTAGKDGFKILTGDAQPNPQGQNYEQRYPQKQYVSYDSQNYQDKLGYQPPKALNQYQIVPQKPIKSQYQYVPSKPSGPIKINYQYVPSKPAPPTKADYHYQAIKPAVPVKTNYEYLPVQSIPPKQYQYAPQGTAQGEPQVKRDLPARDNNAIEQEAIEPEYNDEPGKPYSFGTGYSFHFTS